MRIRDDLNGLYKRRAVEEADANERKLERMRGLYKEADLLKEKLGFYEEHYKEDFEK